VIVNVDENPPALPLGGLNPGLAPDGRPDNESPMVGSPELDEPETNASVTPYVFVPVVRICWLDGVPATVKS
jgi:hypothetical protein